LEEVWVDWNVKWSVEMMTNELARIGTHQILKFFAEALS
jgi:hypothetical protein